VTRELTARLRAKSRHGNPEIEFGTKGPRMSAERSRSSSLLVLAGFGLATAGAAWYSSRYSRGKRERWYRDLDKPDFAPPDKVFPVVWTSLYILIAWSGWRIWCASPSRDRSTALRLWLSQLAANAKWSKLFFGEHRVIASLADSFAVQGEIWAYMNAAWKVDRVAAGAFVPYAAWVAFATILNAEIARRSFLHA
jgi:translocator protein